MPTPLTLIAWVVFCVVYISTKYFSDKDPFAWAFMAAVLICLGTIGNLLAAIKDALEKEEK